MKKIKKTRLVTPKELKRVRESELKLTQEELAAAMGISRVTITRWEFGARKIPPMASVLLSYMRRFGT
jgi:DNA-binding transcriptional regulator YiaG